MRRLQKIVKAMPRRRTRFHTERGELMPFSAWMRFPRAVIGRVRGVDQQAPWIVPVAVERLDEIIQPTWSVLEFGSGASTAWYAARAARVVSLEDDPVWLEEVRARTSSFGPERCDLRLAALRDFPAVAAQFPPDSFDLVIVDGNDGQGVTRNDCAAAAKPLIKAGGYVVVDDSDVREYQPMLDDVFRGWHRERFIGIKQVPLMAVETTILRRPRAA